MPYFQSLVQVLLRGQPVLGGLLVCAVLVACDSIPEIPAKAEVFGEPVDTTVDSEIARYYLENYLQENLADNELDKSIADLNRQYERSTPDRESLKEISESISVDFASLFLADRLLHEPCNRDLNQAFNNLLEQRSNLDAGLAADYIVLFVPGWDYVENGAFTGADFARPRQLATENGLENYLVALPPTGSVDENAAVLVETIGRHSNSKKDIILAGASSAGPAIHFALADRLSAEHRSRIKAWINLGGILQGSPLIDIMQNMPQRLLFNLIIWFKGWDKGAILSMSTGVSRKRFSRLGNIDPDILVINYLGIPLSGQLSQYSGDKYPLLRSEGPNDGLTLLTDVIAPGSMTVVALGNDHFFAEDPRINEKTVALMKLVVSYLDQGLPMRCS